MFQGGQNGIATAVPKSRGFKSLRTPAQVVYLDRLEGLKGIVDNYALYEANLIATPFHTVKVIARGELGSKITLKTQGASRNVVAAIEKAGGSFDKVATPIQKSAKEAEATDKK
jgi:large subunit ribosomal protein L15